MHASATGKISHETAVLCFALVAFGKSEPHRQSCASGGNLYESTEYKVQSTQITPPPPPIDNLTLPVNL